jgi:hypothetical protein
MKGGLSVGGNWPSIPAGHPAKRAGSGCPPWGEFPGQKLGFDPNSRRNMGWRAGLSPFPLYIRYRIAVGYGRLGNNEPKDGNSLSRTHSETWKLTEIPPSRKRRGECSSCEGRDTHFDLVGRPLLRPSECCWNASVSVAAAPRVGTVRSYTCGISRSRVLFSLP